MTSPDSWDAVDVHVTCYFDINIFYLSKKPDFFNLLFFFSSQLVEGVSTSYWGTTRFPVHIYGGFSGQF